MTARADLHVHSKHSNQPPEWILRQFRAPESYTEPLEIYRLCRQRGMDFVTISDHDSVDGALEIAHLPGTFLSSEVTVEFPEDGCEIHCLVLGISEEQHREVQRLRRNVYELRDYLCGEDVLHAVAHPLFRVNDRLTLDHVEKLLVLFNRFEGLNGIHDRRANDLVRRIFGALTREVIESLAERHRLQPVGPAPWRKTFTGGSDDHGGFYIATTFTRTPPAATVADYLAHLRAGRHEPGGDTGSTLRLVQSLYSIAWEYYRRQFPAVLGNRKDPFAELLRGLARPRHAAHETSGRAAFAAVGRAQRQSLSALARDFVRQLRRGRLAESLSAVSHLAPLALSVAPFLVSVHAQHKDADLLEMASLRFLGQRPEGGRPGRMAWFAEPLAGTGEMLKTFHALSAMARLRGCALEAITCGGAGERLPAGLPAYDFEPLLRIPLDGDEALAVPPLLEILDHCERERYAEIVVSAAGPLGLAGLAAGKLLGIRLTGIYSADLPLAVLRLTGSPALEELAWVYVRWFFGRVDRVTGLEIQPAEVEAEAALLQTEDSEALALQSTV